MDYNNPSPEEVERRKASHEDWLATRYLNVRFDIRPFRSYGWEIIGHLPYEFTAKDGIVKTSFGVWPTKTYAEHMLWRIKNGKLLPEDIPAHFRNRRDNPHPGIYKIKGRKKCWVLKERTAPYLHLGTFYTLEDALAMQKILGV